MKKTSKFYQWLGRQNVFIVFFLLFAFIYFSQKVYANFLKPQKENTQFNTEEIVVPTQTPVYKPELVKKPSPKPTTSVVLPTFNPNPIIDCKIPESCGGGIKKFKRSECKDMVCCSVNGKEYDFISITECNQKKANHLDEIKKDFENKMKEYEKYLEDKKQVDYEQEIEENSQQIENYQFQIQSLYDDCVQDVKDQAIHLCSTNNTCDSYGYGSPSWYIEKETQNCKNKYGF